MHKKYYILSFFLFLFFACNYKNGGKESATFPADSLNSYLKKANDFSSTSQLRLKYISNALNIIMKQSNDSLHRDYLFRIANRYYNLNKWIEYGKVSKIALKKSFIAKDTLNIAKAYSYLGDYYGAQGVSDSAYLHYFKSEKIYLQQNDNLNFAKTRLNKAILQFDESDFSGCEISALKALKILKTEKSKETEYELYNLLGLVYNELGEYNKAIEYHNKALEVLKQSPNPIEYQSKATSMNNLGLVYLNLEQYQKAVPYFEEGLKDKKGLLLYKPFVYALLMENLGYSRFKLNISKELPDLFYNSLELRNSLKLTAGVIVSQIHLSEYYASKNNKLKALEFSHEALKTARKSNNARNLLSPLKQLALIEPKKALEYNKEYISLNDSIQKADRKIADKFTRIEYETEEILKENSDLTDQNKKIVFAFGAILIFSIFWYVIKNQKIKNAELLFKQEQQKANEEIYNLIISQQNEVENIRELERKRLSQELHDGILGRMFGVRMNLDSLNNINNEQAFEQRDSYINELKNIEQDIRDISHDLNKEKSELINNFVAIVLNLLENQKKTFSPKLFSSFDSAINWKLISNSVKINLYRIIQESLQNINKYANATEIRIELSYETSAIKLKIVDNGIGFVVNRAKKGIGLQSMLTRVNDCKGNFEIHSEKGKGTEINVIVPV